MVSIAIIGSGPAGCYVAEHLLKLLPEARIDVLEKLPVPFGLIRYGVAPDHQSTKGAARVMERTLARDRCVSSATSRSAAISRCMNYDQMYHVVVLATGATRDRKLGVPGEELPGVIGSGAFVSWYNGHPSRVTPELREVRSAVIIGNGNVALDVARILAKHGDELKGSDLPPDVLETLRSQKIEDIHIVGRRSAAEAKFNEHELEELGGLQRARPVIENLEGLRGETPVQKVLQKFARDERTGLPLTIHFHFGMTPVAFTGSNISREEGREMDASSARPRSGPDAEFRETGQHRGFNQDSRLRSVCFRTNSGEEVEIPAQLAVTCIGYEAVPCCTATPANGVFANDAGKIADGILRSRLGEARPIRYDSDQPRRGIAGGAENCV